MHDDQNETSPAPSGVPSLLIVMMTIAALALGVSAYLSYVSIVTGTAPAGCGAGSGCGEVLTSKWSKLAGVPVSVLAAGLYLVALVALPMARTGRAARFVLIAAATAISAAALWFIYLQLGLLKAICPYCMADHALGLVLSALIFVAVAKLWRSSGSAAAVPDESESASVRRRGGSARYAPAVALGLLSVVGLILVQVNTAAPVKRVELPTDRDFDLGTGKDRQIGTLGGKLHLAPHDEPVIGSPDAPQMVVVMLDYCCPKCRETHELLMQVKEERGDGVAILALPTPLNKQCNPYAPDAELLGARFEHSCELARLALAVALAAPGSFAQFDHWLYEPELPRSPEQARAEAQRLLGDAISLEQVLADSRITEKLARNVEAYGQHSGSDRLPVTFAPGVKPFAGMIYEKKVLMQMLEEMARTPADGDAKP